MSTSFTKPNVVIPMALSYQQRGISGLNQVLLGRDQRKVNSYYEVASNALIGKRSINLTKRPGFIAAAAFGSADNVQYLITKAAGSTGNPFDVANSWVFSKNGNNSRVSSTSATTDILNDANYSPAYSDHCLISGADTVFVQLHRTTGQQRVFYSSAIATWTEISAAAFTSIQHVIGKMEHIDGYTIAMGTDNKLYNSNLNTLQTGYTNYITKEIRQDNAAGLAKYGRQILAFGDRTVEVFYNAGNVTGSPLKRLAPLAQDIGLGVLTQTFVGTPGFRQYYTVTQNRLFFVGRSGGGTNSVGVFAYDGSRFEKVSTQFIDKIIESNTVYGVETVGFLGNDAVAINLSSVSNNPQSWLMFLPAWNDWFEWTSGSCQPVNHGGLFLARGGVTAPHFVSRIANGGDEPTNAYIDVSASGTFEMITQFKVPQDDNALTPMAWAGVQADSHSASASSSAGAFLQMYLSDDGGTVYDTTPYQIDLRQRSKVVHRLGSYEERWVRLVHSGDAACRIQNFIAKTL